MASAEGGLRIGTFTGAAVVVEPSVLLFALYIVGSAALNEGVGATGDALVFVGAILLAVLLHEFCHAAVAAALKLPSKRIVLTFFGGHVEFAGEPSKRWHDIAVSAAGPLVNIISFLVVLLVTRLLAAIPTPPSAAPSIFGALGFLQTFGYVSAWLGLFNLLPGFPLDGGRILRALLSYLMPRSHASLAAAWVGVVIALAIVAFAVWQQWLWTIMIGALLALSAWAEVKRAGYAAQSSAASNA